MSEQLRPQAGEVWRSESGELRVIGMWKGVLCWSSFDVTGSVQSEQKWFATAKRVFPPADQPPAGETMEIALLEWGDGEISAFGRLGVSAVDAASVNNRNFTKHVFTVRAQIPSRAPQIIDGDVLPAVTAGETVTP